MQNNYSPNKTDQAESSCFMIKALEKLSAVQLDEMTRQHALPHFEIIWILQGSLVQLTDGQEYLLGARSLHCSIPGQLQQFIIDDPVKGYVISFNETFLNDCYEDFNGMQEASFFRVLSQSASLPIGEEQSADMEELALKLMKESENAFLFKNEVLSKYLKILLIYVRRQFEALPSSAIMNNNIMFNHFLWLVENNYKQKKAVADYARDLSVTPSYLNYVVKKTSGYPASHHIQQRIVLEAKRKVSHTGASMKEVAYYLGFDDIYHFSKFFKTSSGMNFTAFKNSSRAARA